jgi:hypothetical protein
MAKINKELNMLFDKQISPFFIVDYSHILHFFKALTCGQFLTLNL